jgi:hypothetical protein
MKKYLLGLIALLIPSAALAQESNFPGSAWINITGPHIGGGETGNWILTAKANQDAVIADLSGWDLSTYVSVGFVKDTKGYEWNNKFTPATGIKLTKQLNNGVFDIGIQYAYESHYGKIYRMPDRNSGGFQVSINYWVGWGR